MAIPGIKYDDGTIGFSANCFPVRTLIRQAEDGGGAWLVEQRAEQRRRFKAVLCAKPKTYSQIREERKKSEKETPQIPQPEPQTPDKQAATPADELEENQILDGFYLMKHCCVDDPADLCSVNISGCGLSEAKEDDFILFDNVAYVNAAENILPFSCFKHFSILRELEVPLNGLRGLKILEGDFPHLEMLDLSYNNLSKEDIVPLGLLPKLKVLHLSGNNFKTLPSDMTKPRINDNFDTLEVFPSLEVLMLDDNKLSDLSTFAILAGLKKLRHLNLQKNEIYSVPQLRVVEGKQYTEDTITTTPRGKKRRPKSRNSSRRSTSRNSPHKGESLDTPKDSHLKQISDDLTINVVTVPNNSVRGDSSKEEAPDSNKETVEKPAEETTSRTELADTDFNLEDFESKIDQMNLESDIRTSRADIQEDEPKQDDCNFPPPFPELHHLNLAFNQIAEEEGLLALAAWPMLSELLIHDNPLTTERSGDPPLLKRFLNDRLGIEIVRKKPGPLPKPNVDVSTKPGRKVKTKVPKIPKRNIDEILLAIEAPYKSTPTKSSLEQSRPLPPISTTPDGRSKSAGARPRSRECETEREPQEAWAENVHSDEETEANTFFMTQVGDIEESAPTQMKKVHVEPKKEGKKKPKKDDIPDKFKGYEILLDAEDDTDFVPPKDIQGNIRSLQYLLNHPLVFKENQVQLDKVHRPYKPYVKSTLKYNKSPVRKEDRIQEALEKIKDSSAMVEAGLGEVLVKKKKYKKDFPEASDLLSNVQQKYNSVRVSSMKNARTPHKPDVPK